MRIVGGDRRIHVIGSNVRDSMERANLLLKHSLAPSIKKFSENVIGFTEFIEMVFALCKGGTLIGPMTFVNKYDLTVSVYQN